MEVPTKPTNPDEPAVPPPLWPNVWLSSWIVFAVVFMAVMQTPDLNDTVASLVVKAPDHAIMNILTMLAGIITFVAVVVWLWVSSGHLLWVKIAPIASVVLFFTVFRIDGCSGEVWPNLVTRWTPAHDKEIGAAIPVKPSQDAPAVDLSQVADTDFPGFLGRNRDAAIDNIRLNRDWTAHPPKLVKRFEKIGDGWSGFAVVNGYGVTLEQRDTQEVVTCYRLRTGELVWSHGHEARHENALGGLGPRSTPTIHEGRVYALGATGWLYCLKGSDGTPIWEKNLQHELGLTQAEDEALVMWGRAASPLIVDNLCVVPYGGKPGKAVSLVAYDKLTGAKIWEGGDRQVSFASPMLATLGGVRQILSVNEDNVSAHNPETGKVLWTHDFPGNSTGSASASQPHVLSDSLVFLSKGYAIGSRVIEVKQDKGEWQVEVVWDKSNLLNTKFTNAAIYQGFAYGLDDGILECVEVETGRKAWKRGRYEQGQLLRVGDLLLVQAESGEVVLVECNPEKHVELGKLDAMNSQTWNNLALAGNLLVVRSGREAAVYEVELEKATESGEKGVKE